MSITGRNVLSPRKLSSQGAGPLRNRSVPFTQQLIIKPVCSSLRSQWSQGSGNMACWETALSYSKKKPNQRHLNTLRMLKKGVNGMNTWQRKLSNFLFNYWDKKGSLVSFSCSNRNLFKYLNRKASWSTILPSCNSYGLSTEINFIVGLVWETSILWVRNWFQEPSAE